MSNDPDVPRWEPGDVDYRPCPSCRGSGRIWCSWLGGELPCDCGEEEPETEEGDEP